MTIRNMIIDKLKLMIAGKIDKKQISDWALKLKVKLEDEYVTKKGIEYDDLVSDVLSELIAGEDVEMGYAIGDYKILLKKLEEGK